MPQIPFAAIGQGIASAASALYSSGALAFAASVALTAVSQQQQRDAVNDARKGAQLVRDITLHSTVAPQQIIYGRARVSGPLQYANTCKTFGSHDNADLALVVVLAGHECDGFEDLWADNARSPGGGIDYTTGVISSGDLAGAATVYAYLGTTTQAANAYLIANFPADITSNFRGRGWTYVVCQFVLSNLSKNIFLGEPQNVHVLVRGKKVFDPRKAPRSPYYQGVGSHVLTNPSTWGWSDNPALCAADYLIDTPLGMGLTTCSIHYGFVARAADICDASVSTPTGPQKRYTCNGVVSATAAHRENLTQIVSSMMGDITWVGGKYRIRAGAFETPTTNLTAHDFAGAVAVRTAMPRDDRYNIVRALFFDPAHKYTEHESQQVFSNAYQIKDGNRPLTLDLTLPMTNDEYMAQRISYKQLLQSQNRQSATFILKMIGMSIAVGDRFTVTLADLSWVQTVWRCVGWKLSDQGVVINAESDSANAYLDPIVSDYQTPMTLGSITVIDPNVSFPTGLAVTVQTAGFLLTWTAAAFPATVARYLVYASTTSAWSGATLVGSVTGTSLVYNPGATATLWFWVRGEDNYNGVSDRSPDSDTSTITGTFVPAVQLTGSKTFDWPSIANGATSTTTVTVTGALAGDFCSATMSISLAGMTLTAACSAADTVTCTMTNNTGAAVDLASGTLTAKATR